MPKTNGESDFDERQSPALRPWPGRSPHHTGIVAIVGLACHGTGARDPLAATFNRRGSGDAEGAERLDPVPGKVERTGSARPDPLFSAASAPSAPSAVKWNARADTSARNAEDTSPFRSRLR